MLGLVKEISGQKTIVPLTTDTGTGASVGTLISQYKKVPMSGYLYCDGSAFDNATLDVVNWWENTKTTSDLGSHSHSCGRALGDHAHTISAKGGNQPHDNMPPYVVKYCWERIA